MDCGPWLAFLPSTAFLLSQSGSYLPDLIDVAPRLHLRNPSPDCWTESVGGSSWQNVADRALDNLPHPGALKAALAACSWLTLTFRRSRSIYIGTFIQSDLQPLSHRSHTDSGVNLAGRQLVRGAVRMRCLAQGHLHTLSLEEPEIELATFRLSVNPLRFLS